MRPAFRALATSAAASCELTARGFSQTTCLPCARASVARAPCVAFGEQMWTTSISSEVASSSGVPKARSAPRRRAASRERSGVDVATPASRAPARRADRACTAPMKPAPTIPARAGAPATVSVAVDASFSARAARSVSLSSIGPQDIELLRLVKQKFRDFWVELLLWKRLATHFLRRRTAKLLPSGGLRRYGGDQISVR